MNDYLNSIQSIEQVYTSIKEEINDEVFPIKDVDSDNTDITQVDNDSHVQIILEDSPYINPQKVRVRKYRLKK